MSEIPNLSPELYEELQELHTLLREQRDQLVKDVEETQRAHKRALGRLDLLDKRLFHAAAAVELFDKEEKIPEALPL